MSKRLSLLIILCGATLTANAQVFRAQSDTQVEACGAQSTNTSGGSGSVTTQSRLTDRGACPEQSVVAASAYADLASGYAYVAASAEGVAGANRARGAAQYTELLTITSTTNTVHVRATLVLVAEATGSEPGGDEFLFARITAGPAGEIELRGCNPTFCPDEPVVSATLSAQFSLQRNSVSGLFPPIGVAATAIIDARGGGGFYVARTAVEVIDDSGAQIDSASGNYGTQMIADGDADGAPDAIDTCVSVANPSQRDSDGDGFGNACDADLNNDASVNALDLSLMRQRFFGTDADADLNGDGVVNVLDLGLLSTLFGLPPGD